jgi:hypothetical protein
MTTIFKLLVNATIAWIAGLAFISVTLYVSNDGADFTTTDLMGFGVMAGVASALLMLAIYLPSLYWLRRRLGGVRPRNRFLLLTGLVCNLPIFLLLAILINRKMSALEAVGFMLTFLIIGASFGLGFTFATTRN